MGRIEGREGGGDDWMEEDKDWSSRQRAGEQGHGPESLPLGMFGTSLAGHLLYTSVLLIFPKDVRHPHIRIGY